MLDNKDAPVPTRAEIPLANLRDLGGMPVAGGKVLRSHTLWRSDDVAIAPVRQMTELMDLGLRTIIDLRSFPELHLSGTGPAADLGLLHRHMPLLQDTADPEFLAKFLADVDTPQRVGLWYAGLFRTQTPLLIEALSLIADSTGGVLFHCAAGKDRTGILAAAILSAVGVEREAIVEDYLITQPNMGSVRARLAQASMGRKDSGRKSKPAQVRPILLAHRESITALFTDLERDGGPLGVLRNGGLGENTLERLRARLVES